MNIYEKLKNRAKSTKGQILLATKKRVNLRKKDIYISIGENCLPDDILARNHLKSFSTPFSSGRSNIEYILDFENEEYADFLNMDYLHYESVGNGKVVRNTKYLTVQNRYKAVCMNGFEFTHHDVIGNNEIRETMGRRVKRMLNLKNKNITMLYHHRKCDETDINLLLRHLLMLSSVYEKRSNKVRIILFYQEIIPDYASRRVECSQYKNIDIFKYYTQNEWAGEEQNLLWARCDNDLLETMIKAIKANH